jgi:hypothetical protein
MLEKHKAPMALYWKIVAVYARHMSQVCRGVALQAAADGAPGRAAELEAGLRELLEYGGHIAINTVGDVRLQAKLMKARENAARLLAGLR